MFKNKFAAPALACLLLTASVAALADSVTNAGNIGGQSQLTDKAGSASVLDDLYLNYFGIFHGPAVRGGDSAYTVQSSGDNAGKTTVGTQRPNPIYADSEVTAAYMITKDIGLGPQVQFAATPVFGKGLTLGDYGIKVFDRHFINYKGFNMYANFYLQAAGGYDLSRQMGYALKTTPAFRYDIQNSRFFVGAWTELKDYMNVSAGATFKVYALPYVAYQLTPTLALDVGYEMETHHNVGDTQYLNLTTTNTDFQPGVTWRITPKLLFNPYLQLFTGTAVTTETTALGAVISATL